MIVFPSKVSVCHACIGYDFFVFHVETTPTLVKMKYNSFYCSLFRVYESIYLGSLEKSLLIMYCWSFGVHAHMGNIHKINIR